jgi:hypothetical protein
MDKNFKIKTELKFHDNWEFSENSTQKRSEEIFPKIIS